MDLLGLFSEDTPRRNTSQIAGLSSPVQSNEKLRGYELESKKNELLQARNTLKDEVANLEQQWNELRNNLEAGDVNKEEDDLIWKLMIQKSDQEVDNNSAQEQHTDDDPDEPGNDLDKFSAKPSKDWNLRIEYLKKFYKDLTITNQSSRTSLTYPESSTKPKTIKIISFDISYPRKVISLTIKIHLLQSEHTFKTDHLDITKTSNNKLNTSILDIVTHYTNTRNINGLLSSLNSLYRNLQNRQSTLQELSKELHQETLINILQSQFVYKELVLHWDLLFKKDKILGILNVNDSLNVVFTDLLEQYGVVSAFLRLVEKLYPKQ